MADEGEHSESNKVTADSYGNVKVSEADKECWMLRVPPKLAQAWENMPEGTVLGELVFRKGGKATGGRPAFKPSLEITVDPKVAQAKEGSSAASSSLPLQYSLQAMTKKLPTLHPFTRFPNGSVKIHGTVTRTGNLQVIQDARYRQLCKNRILQSTVHSSRFVKPVDSNQVVQQTNKSDHSKKGFGEAIHQYGKRLIDQANQTTQFQLASKRAKFTADQPTKSVVFQLFSQQQYWTLKDLKAASGGRPDNEIRDVLREIGDYHRSGDHKNTWELRKEFQNTSTSSAGGASTGPSAGGEDARNN